MRRSLARSRQSEDAVRHAGTRDGRSGHRDERIQEYRTVMVLGADCRRAKRVRRMRVNSPMRVDSSAVVMVGGVVVRVSMDQRPSQCGALYRYGQRECNNLAHGAYIVRDGGD